MPFRMIWSGLWERETGEIVMNTSESKTRVKVAAILISFILLLAVSPAAGQVFSDDAERAIMGTGVSGGWQPTGSLLGTPSQVQVHSGKYSYAFQNGQIVYQAGYTAPDPQY